MDNAAETSMDMGLAGVKMASGLLIILGLIFLGFFLLKKFGHKAGFRVGGNSSLKLMSSLSLGPKKSIVVVRFLNRDLVLGVTDSRINLLTETQAHDKSEENFSQVLSESSDRDSP